MTPITQTCRISGNQFVVSDEDQAFLKRLNMPLPTLCPEERSRRRMSFRNDHNLYYRKCSKTGKQVISLYLPDSPFTIYNQELYWSDAWDAHDYGRDFDFTRPFFEQFKELQNVVPRIAINGQGNVNCDYTSYAGWSKNCYLTFTADRNEDCFYGAYAFDNNDCCDFLFSDKSEFCYEIIDCNSCYHCMYGLNLRNCSDCIMCRDCIGCDNCFGCVGLRSQKYCYFNEQLSKEDYEKKIKNLNLDSYKSREDAKKKVADFILKYPRKNLDIKGCENVVGDHIKFSKNCFLAYDIKDCEDCRYVSHLVDAKDSMDWDYYGYGSEMCYEISSAVQLKFCAFCMNSWDGNSNLYYCDLMSSSKNCFGCIGIKRGNYCILNKQHTQEEYEELLPRIIEHMKKTGEWGEFFPSELSPYCYNETVAQDYMPLTKEEVKARGLRWLDNSKQGGYDGPPVIIPDHAKDADESFCKQILTCEISGKNYKIIPQELAFYKKHNIPLPRRAPDQRYLDRMALRNPRHWWIRNCDKCGSEMHTTYASDRPEIVYCEDCYMKEVY